MVSGSRRSSQNGTKGVGGTYHTRQRRKDRSKAAPPPETDMSKWAELTALVRESWDVMLERVSFEEIGVFIYDKITQQEQLEPLFSFADKAMQGRKFVDMLNRLNQHRRKDQTWFVPCA